MLNLVLVVVQLFEDFVDDVSVLPLVSFNDMDEVAYSLESHVVADFFSEDIVQVHFYTVLRCLEKEIFEVLLHRCRTHDQVRVW